jgi:hypothetical protein
MAKVGKTAQDVPVLGALEQGADAQERGEDRQAQWEAKAADQEANRQSREQMTRESIQGRKDTAAMIAALKGKSNFKVDDINPGDPVDKIVDKIGSGEITFDQLTKIYPGFSKNAVKREAIMEKVMEKYPDYSPAQNALEFKWGNNPGAIKTVAAANNALANVDKLIDISDHWNRTGSPIFNKFLKEAQFQIGDRTVTNIKEMQTAVGDEVAGVLGFGQASDLKTKLGLDLTDPNVSAENFKSNMVLLKHMLETRRKTMAAPMGKYSERQGIKSETAQEGATSQPQSGPAIGTVKGGYRFKGGNPADKNSWEPVK